MNLLDVVRDVRRHLEESGRLSLRLLRRQYGLDDDAVAEVIEELVDVLRVARREEGMLVWAASAPEGGATAQPPPAPSPPAPHPRAHAPKRLADKILQARSTVEGERKQVTVLFADVRGSMELAEQMDPEAWSAIMQRFFTILSDGVERFEGFVDKFTGDGIMALFGAPIAHEDHAQRACYAALHLRDDLARYATDVKREHGVGFSTRMGINSGEVIVGAIGDDLRMTYTAQGHTVGLAQRMEALASPDTCYVTAATAARVGGYLRLEDLGDFRVKGVSEPVRVHRLVGAGTATTRLDVSRARGLSRFVGRDTDMATLEAALVEAQAGHGQVVGIVAPAGTGKSRLCWEFAERCRARGITVNEGHAVAHGKSIPYLPILEVFRAYFGIGDADDDATAREKIAGRLLLLDETFRAVLPVLFEFCRVPDPERPVARMDPDAKQRQLFAVVRRVIQDRRAGADRVFALIEDLHWFDAASEAMLAQWVDAVAGSSSLLVVNFRPEYRAEWMQKSYYRQIPLAPLGSDAIRALLADLLGGDPSTQGLAEDIHARTGGNPFFIEEVVQGLIESGHLDGTHGAYRLVRPLGRLDVPPSVQALLAARIDRLGDAEKRVLQTAAVIGKEFSEPILRQVLAATGRAGLANGNLAAALETLETREFLYETSLFPVAAYAFKHPLTQEVALGSQLQERRRQVHAAVAQAIEATHAGKLDEQAALLAHHSAEAGQPLVAAEWHARAATFIGRSDFAAAARHWQQARELLRTVPDDPRAPVLGANACFRVLSLAFRVSPPEEEVQRVFQEGLDWAGRTDDPLWSGRLNQAMAVFEATGGRVDAALRYAGEWERVARALPDAERRACALWPTLLPLITCGDLARLRTSCEQQIVWTAEHPEWGLRDWGISALGDALARRAYVDLIGGGFADARARIERAIDVTRRLKDIEGEIWAIVVFADLGFFAGEPDLARTAIERALRMSEPMGTVSMQWTQSRYGRQLLLDGRATEAVEALEHALTYCATSGGWIEPWVRQVLAQAWLAAGDPVRARALAEGALGTCLDTGARLFGIEAALALSAALRAEPGGAAARRIDDVLATADRLIAETGARNLTAFVCVERAALAALQGDVRQEAAHRRGAHDAFTRTGATGRARETAAALAKVVYPH